MRHFLCTSFPLLQNELVKHCLNVALYYRAHDVHLKEPPLRTYLGIRAWMLTHRTSLSRFDGAHFHSNVQQLEGALTKLVVSNNHLYKMHLWLAEESKTCFMGAELVVLSPEVYQFSEVQILNCRCLSSRCCFTLT